MLTTCSACLTVFPRVGYLPWKPLIFHSSHFMALNINVSTFLWHYLLWNRTENWFCAVFFIVFHCFIWRKFVFELFWRDELRLREFVSLFCPFSVLTEVEPVCVEVLTSSLFQVPVFSSLLLSKVYSSFMFFLTSHQLQTLEDKADVETGRRVSRSW